MFADCSRRRLVRDLSEADVQHADAPTGWPGDCGEGAGISPDINPGAGRAQQVYAHFHPDAFAEDYSRVSFSMPEKAGAILKFHA